MEQKVIVKNQNQCIYLMKESNLDFYLIIPNSKEVKIVLGLFEDINDEAIKKLPFQQDKAIVIPVIQKQVLMQANIINSPSFRYLEQVLSILINTTYKILSYNQLKVDTQVLLNYNQNLNVFHQTFITKYQGRVQTVQLFPQVPTPTVEKAQPVIQQPTLEAKQNILETKIDEVIPTEMPNETKEPMKVQKEAHEPGFVSYVLLGVLVAVISLVFLYLII